MHDADALKHEAYLIHIKRVQEVLKHASNHQQAGSRRIRDQEMK
jgi:hypothetical protein